MADAFVPAYYNKTQKTLAGLGAELDNNEICAMEVSQESQLKSHTRTGVWGERIDVIVKLAWLETHTRRDCVELKS